ncbi:M16 family metallopeptidase [Sphingomonas sp. FW199]|uniref:M16 family metallopeptidase n=1 Tax=Sphingomonas sp. FW199 TaxID=3400217 RepID=UPI003CED44F0
MRTAWLVTLGALLSACIALPAVGQSAPPPPTDAAAPAPDPADARWGTVRQGRLPNGVRYVIVPRRSEDSGIGLYMRIEGGFIAEQRPGERGLAHLIEHLVFTSPTTGSPDDLYHFRHIGVPMSYPAPTAGTTTWDHSDYFMSTRTRDPQDIDTLLGLFREAVSDLTLRADAVDLERAEVVREMADKRPGNDIHADYIAAVAPGSPNDVMDAQNSDDVPTASIDTIRALYHRLYRPEHTMIVLVGDVDADRIEQLVERHFARWTGMGAAAPLPPPPTIQADRVQPVSHSASGKRAIAMMTMATPTPPTPRDPMAYARQRLMDAVVIQAVNTRLAAAFPGASPGAAGMHIEQGELGQRLIMLWNGVTDGNWRPVIGAIKQLTCSLSRSGFTAAEWQAARAAVLETLRRDRDAMFAVTNIDIARQFGAAATMGAPVIPPDARHALAEQWLPMIDHRAGHIWWRDQWNPRREHIRVESAALPAGDVDANAMIRAAPDASPATPGCAVRG